ncbi:MAG: hypothetical protein KDC18_14650, partial [Alphaproteobacteria bacterium]|nr:hypothetical protein [Alphaproteobacteria bacterium]
MADPGHWRFGDGVRQGDRLPEALADGYFHVDERNFAALLAGLSETAGRLPFVDQANRFAGTWQRLFAREDLVVMAEILATRTAPLERRFLDALHRDPAKAGAELRDLAARIDGWLQRLGQLPARPAVELHRRTAELVRTRLGPALAHLPAALLPSGLDPAWGAARDADRRSAVPPGHDPRHDPRHGLQGGFSTLISAVRLLQSMVPAYFQDSLARADHEPAFALVLAFLRLFGDTQQHLNGFTRRHNDFYYRDVLGTRERPAMPEQVLLAFPAATAREALPIRRGDPVLATTADGAPPLRFQADAEAFASTARIAGLHALHFERDPLLSPQREMDFVTRIHRLRLPVEPPAEQGAPSWSLFGRDAAGAEAADAAPMGLVVSTPLLLLREGQRRLDLQLVLRPLGGRAGAAAGAVLDPARCETWLRADPGLVDACGLGPAKTAAARIIAGSTPAQRTVQPAHAALFPDDPLYLVFVLALIRIATPERPRGFSAPFGRLMARLMLGPDRRVPSALSAAEQALVDELADAADRVLAGSDAPEGGDRHGHGASVRTLLTESRVYQYAKYLSDAFTLDLSTAKGWLRIPEIGVAPLETEAGASGRIGLRIVCDLAPDAPAIEADPTAPAAGGDRLPVPAARLLLAPGATLCAYSLLAPFVLEEVEAVVAVEGLRSLKGYSELGPVDATKPFQPFGPAPRIGSSFIVGAYEPALKRVETAHLRLVWSGLPRDFGGFPAYYRQYGEDWSDARFGAEIDWLAGGVWVPASGGEPVPLFGAVDGASRLPATRTLDMRSPAAAEPLPPRLAATDFRYDLAAQGGFVRLRLTGPPGAFGHQLYPLLLSRNMTRTAFWRGPREPINPPYTPVLAGLELDYTARTIIRVSQVPREHAYRQAEFIDHVVPYGSEEVHPVPLQPEPGPLQRRPADGALHIALSGTGPGKPVSLLFWMAERARRRRRYDVPAVAWQYLADGAWRSLPHDLVLADTTSALMRSGLLTLTLPDDLAEAGDAAAGGPRVPGTGHWLRIVTDADPATFPRVARLLANGLTASRVVTDGVPHKPLPAGIAWQLETTPPGLGAMVEVRAATGG